MTIQEDMRARLQSRLGALIADGGGKTDKPYLSAMQIRTISSVILETFFIVDRMELNTPKVYETGNAIRQLHKLNHSLSGSISSGDDWSLACEKLVAAIHDVEALELCLEWKEKKDKENEELENFAYKLYNLSHPLGHWAALDPSAKNDWINIAENAKRLLT